MARKYVRKQTLKRQRIELPTFRSSIFFTVTRHYTATKSETSELALVSFKMAK